jgi:hypothetical protein
MRSRERIADTLVWLPTLVAIPTASSTDLTIAAARDLTTTFQNSSPTSPLSQSSKSQVTALQRLASIFATVTTIQPTPSPATTSTVSPGFPTLPRVAPASVVAPPPTASTTAGSTHFRVLFQLLQFPPIHFRECQFTRQYHQSSAPPVPPAVTYQHRTSNARNRCKSAVKQVAVTNTATKKTCADSTTQHQHNIRSRPRS